MRLLVGFHVYLSSFGLRLLERSWVKQGSSHDLREPVAHGARLSRAHLALPNLSLFYLREAQRSDVIISSITISSSPGQ